MNVNNAGINRRLLYNNLRTSISKAYQAYTNALTRLRTERINNTTAANLLNLVVQRFNLGVGTVVDVREAQRSFLEAGYRLVNISYSAKVAEIELKRLANLLAPS
jgi:outer membrane protein TolC